MIVAQPSPVHDFRASLALSAAQADAPWWEIVYRQAFPDFATMVCVRKDGWAQRGGIDRVITLCSGRTVTVDEKVRDKDWGDILWEYLSDRDRNIEGWCAKDLACDYIAYAFIPSQKCYLLPALQLRKAWLENNLEWIAAANAGRHGYRIVDANNGRYVTRSVAVPLKESMRAIRDALCVRWT
jgi:hypothetical protein